MASLGGPPFGFVPTAVDLDAVRRTLRRRVTLVLVGLAIVLVGLQIDAVALG